MYYNYKNQLLLILRLPPTTIHRLYLTQKGYNSPANSSPIFYLLFLLPLSMTVYAANGHFEKYESSDNEMASSDFYCFSCASTSYLDVWNSQLVGHYFPPKNFTEGCWAPDPQVGLTFCTSACFTIVEEIYTNTISEAVMRGCMDRFLLFGLDADIKISISNLRNRACRTMDRRLMNLVPLNNDIPSVLICSCVGNMCNNDEVEADSTTFLEINSINIFIFCILHFLCKLFF